MAPTILSNGPSFKIGLRSDCVWMTSFGSRLMIVDNIESDISVAGAFLRALPVLSHFIFTKY